MLPLVVSLLAEAARAGAAERELDRPRLRVAAHATASGCIALAIVRRETGIMAVSALVIFLLALRAATTGEPS